MNGTNDLNLTDKENDFLKLHNGFYDTKRNIIIIPATEWDMIQNELNTLIKTKKANEEAFNAKEREINEKIYNANASIQNEEKQLQEKLTRIQNEEFSLQLRLKQNDKDGLERKFNKNEEKIKNEKINQAFFLNQSQIAMENKLIQLEKLKALEKVERDLKEKLMAINEEMLEIQTAEKKREKISQLENMQMRALLEKKIKEIEIKIEKITCVLCKSNVANVVYETCLHLGCCACCLNEKSKISTPDSKLICPICNTVNTQSYSVMIP